MGRPPFRRAAAILAAALLVAACGDDDATTTADETVVEETTASTNAADDGGDTTPSTTSTTAEATTTTLPGGADQVIEVAVTGDSVENGGRHEVAVGDTVALVITSDVEDQVHVHGYDLYADIGPAGPATVLVEATIPGVWEVELHDSGLPVVELAVS